MATVTPNFNWPVPTSTDLVKDGATAIEALGDSIDGSLVDLKGGTTGQVLSKTSGTDMDFTWVTTDDANAIQNSIVDAKGDLIAATANDTPARLAVGTNGQVLTADSTAATGIKWATPATPSSGMTLINRTSFSSQATVNIDNVFTTSYKTYLVVLEGVTAVSDPTNDLLLLARYTVGGPGTITSGYYGTRVEMVYNSTTVTGDNTNGGTFFKINNNSGDTAGQIYFNKVGGASAENPIWQGTTFSEDYLTSTSFMGACVSGSVIAGFQLKSSSTNITGTVATYGLAI
jgi:hypothetical protein